MTRPTYIVEVRAWQGRLLITAPGVRGAVSQAHTTEDVEVYAREAIAFVLNRRQDSFDIDVVTACPNWHPETGDPCVRKPGHWTAHMAGAVADGTAAYWQAR